MDATSKEQYLGLKVMRLLKPSLYSALPFYGNYTDNLSNIDNNLYDSMFSIKENNSINTLSNICLSDFLILPQSFGNIFLGETFSSYLCIHNHSKYAVKQMSVKVELQTKTQKISVMLKSDLGDFVERFDPNQTYNGLIQHAVKEIGIHVLVCSVDYTNEKDEKLNFKKFFKFCVAKPFEIQPKFNSIQNDYTILFEAQIQNVTNNVLYMEKVFFEPTNNSIAVTEIKSELISGKSIHKKKSKHMMNSIKPAEIKHYLFKIISKQNEKITNEQVTGKLDIVWRNPFSDIGRLQTNPLSQTETQLRSKKELEIEIKELKDFAYVGELLKLDLSIQNLTERPIELSLKLDNTKASGYCWISPELTSSIKLAPNGSYAVQLEITPTQSGFMEISGIELVDLLLRRVYDLSRDSFIFVLDKTEK